MRKNAWEALAKNLQREKAIMGYRNTAVNLRKLYDNGLATIKFFKNGWIMSYSALWSTNDLHWLEIGSFWVHPKKRRRGYLTEVTKELFRNIPKEKGVFAITHSVKAVMHVLGKNGLSEIPKEKWNNIVPFSVTCSPCDREEKINCELKGSECRLFA